MIQIVAMTIVVLGALIFIRGLRQYQNPDMNNIPLVSPVGKQIMGGAALIMGIVIFIVSFRKHYDINSNTPKRRR